ncbi:flagellar basal body P-ring formation chaperone FlgA [Noviherbaspirillum galbum]|uniref:Flagella basal body P-ring formation protein FlgA n=1 Tax=Noviherbaspirillum galbum TaxID=2709383 RepID=A0A6B3SPB4_9BURK|nr:flagellar basal body P-ring formation chaperone FlgA [Noviherbaspirillum galbum]NEX62674.1 flagellar basal body P-ring formation protein FlgA [Noviherbaspirillum galbum]
MTLRPLPVLLPAAILMASLAAPTAAQPVARQDLVSLRGVADQFLQSQTAGLPGQASHTLGTIDSRLNLPACPAPEAFLPPGSRLWGKTSIGIRCNAPSNWTIYVPASIQVIAEYVVTAVPLAQGHIVTAGDLTKIKGDLATLPATVITNDAQAIGRSVSASLPAGVPLRSDTLKTQQAIQQGQLIKLTTIGPGFQISSEARALNNATEGQVTQVRTPSGQVISGVAKLGGIVEVTY